MVQHTHLVIDGITLHVGAEVPTEMFDLIADAVHAWSSSRDPAVRGAVLPKTERAVLDQLRAGRAVVLLDGEIVVGYATLYSLLMGQWELGTVMVRPDYRGRHLAKRIYAGVAQLHAELGGIVWETTHSGAVVHLSLTHDFVVESFEQVPDDVRHGLCIEASCFRAAKADPSRCSDEHNHGGGCTLCVRR